MEQFDKNQEFLKLVQPVLGGYHKTDWENLRDIFKRVVESTTAEIIVVDKPVVLSPTGEEIKMWTRKLRNNDTNGIVKELVMEFDNHKTVYFYQFFTSSLAMPLNENSVQWDIGYMVRYQGV